MAISVSSFYDAVASGLFKAYLSVFLPEFYDEGGLFLILAFKLEFGASAVSRGLVISADLCYILI